MTGRRRGEYGVWVRATHEMAGNQPHDGQPVYGPFMEKLRGCNLSAATAEDMRMRMGNLCSFAHQKAR